VLIPVFICYSTVDKSNPESSALWNLIGTGRHLGDKKRQIQNDHLPIGSVCLDILTEKALSSSILAKVQPLLESVRCIGPERKNYNILIIKNSNQYY
jgi:hypothetical protein